MPCNFSRPTRLLTVAASAVIAGCSLSTPLHHQPEPVPPQVVQPAPVAEPEPKAQPTPAPAPTPSSASRNDAATAVTTMLAYADRVRGMAPAEVALELGRLGDARSPTEQMQLALTLAQLRQTPELIRAQDSLTRLLANGSPEAMALHPLARMLASRFGEQRRFEDLLDRQTQQTRDVQRRLEQTTERLEALKALERSLGSQANPPAAGNRAPAVAVPSRPRSTP